jgi:zinc/manganese transport system substrate-binding protein
VLLKWGLDANSDKGLIGRNSEIGLAEISTMEKLLQTLAFCILALSFSKSALALQIVACEPEWAALVTELGGRLVKVRSATSANQDTHHIEPRPSLIAMVRTADLLVCTGFGVEQDWLPILLSSSGNSNIQQGHPGYFEAGNYVQKRQASTLSDYAQVNPRAHENHHIQGDPHNILLIANALAKRLVEIDSPNAEYYLARHKDFSGRWNEAIKRWEKEATPLKGLAVVQHHNAWTYLCHWLGMREVATLEPSKGQGASDRHLNAVLAILEHNPANMILSAPYENSKEEKWLAERAKIPIAVLPMTVGSTKQTKDLFSLFDDTVQRLLKVANQDRTMPAQTETRSN